MGFFPHTRDLEKHICRGGHHDDYYNFAFVDRQTTQVLLEAKTIRHKVNKSIFPARKKKHF